LAVFKSNSPEAASYPLICQSSAVYYTDNGSRGKDKGARLKAQGASLKAKGKRFKAEEIKN
jgi:hypothetical protein